MCVYFYGHIDASLQIPCGNKLNESNKLNALRFYSSTGRTL